MPLHGSKGWLGLYCVMTWGAVSLPPSVGTWDLPTVSWQGDAAIHLHIVRVTPL